MGRLEIRHMSRLATASATTPTSFPASISSPKPIFPTAVKFSHLRVQTTIEKYRPDPLQKPSSIPHHPMATATLEQEKAPAVIKLQPIEATPSSFQEFGQVIEASPDGDEFGPSDAQLNLSQGIPRLYIMHLEDRPLKFSKITHHASVTQCLGSIGGRVWYLGVAKPSVFDPTEIKGVTGADVVQSQCGHFYALPVVEEVRVFRISGSKFLKLNVGTWHAGPLFLDDTMDFYNLELSNTNVVDHTTHDFAKEDKVVFMFDA